MEKINFREMLADQINGSSDAVEFIIDFAEKHQMKGDIFGTELLSQIVKHLAQDSNYQKTLRVIEQNQKAAEAIHLLTKMGCWPQLSGISKHALEAEIEVLAQESNAVFKDSLASNKIRLAVLRMGSDEFKNVFTKEFLDKMG